MSMVKFTLIIWVCSFLEGQTCAPPITIDTIYDSWYECSRAAHTESIRVMSKLGFKEVNQYKLSTKYMCREFKII